MSEAETTGDVTVTRSSLSSGSVWSFFEEIRDVTNLSPAEEQQEAWEAKINGERVGMAVVDTIPTNPLVSRVAVDPSYRQLGAASALLKRINRQHGRIRCRVREDNPPGHELVQSVGFTAVGKGRYGELMEYDTNPPDN